MSAPAKKRAGKVAPPPADAPKRGRPAAAKTYGTKGRITAKLRIMGRFYDSAGESVTEALEGLSIDRNLRGVAILTVSNGSTTVERILQPATIARLFSMSPLTRQVQLKNLFLMIGL